MKRVIIKLAVLAIVLGGCSGEASGEAKGVFVDSSTKLMWQDDEQAINTKKVWITEKKYRERKYMDTSGDTATSYCSNLSLAGYSDWRLPTKSELEGLFKKKDELKNIEYTRLETYWTSTINEGDEYNESVWTVRVRDGFTGSWGKSARLYVRCVRAGR